MTNREHVNLWKEYEKEGTFNIDVNPVNWDDCYRVTEDFPYLQTSKWKSFTNFLKRTFIVYPFTLKINWFERKTKVVGRKNLKGIKTQIVK